MSRRRSRSRDRHRRRRSRSPDRRYRSSRRDDRAPSRTPSPTPRWQRKRMRTYWDLTPEEAQQLGLAGGGFRGPRDPNALDDRQQHRILKSAKRLYIGNVPFGVMEMDLENFINMKMEEKGLINGHGGNSPVCERVHCDPNKQFAFATFRSVEECTNALDLHGSLFAGTELRFQRPRDYIVPIFDPLTGEVTGGEQPPPEMMTSTSGGGGGDRVRPPPVVPDGPNKIFLGGLPGTFSFEQVRELVAAFGQLKHFHLVTDRITGESKGYGFMEYEDPNITEVAITGLNGLEIGGRTLTCQHSSVEGERGAGPGDDARIPGDFKTVLPNQAVLNEEAVPTRILVLMNLMTEEGLAHDANYEDMLNSVRYECEQNGTVLSIHAPRPAMDADGKPAAQQSSGVGKVYVEFRMPQEAEATSTALAGRKFDERFVIMAFYSEALFAQQILQ